MKKFKKVIVMLIIGIFVLSSAAYAKQDGISSNDAVSDEAIQKMISPDVQGEERNVIAQLMKTLRPEDRENVIYITADGKVYANKPELKEGIKQWEKVKGNVYMDQDGNTAPFPVDNIGVMTTDPSGITESNSSSAIAASASGPYRRVASKTGYSWFEGYVHLGTKGTSDVDMKVPQAYINNDTPYAYTGGTSSTGVEVDAGLQYSYTNNDWAWYMKAGALKWTEPSRFRAGQNVKLNFYVPSNDTVTLSITGLSTSGTNQTLSYSHPAAGWNTNGSGCSIKRCTTIAQKSYNLTTGSYHKNARWYSSKIGTSSSSNHTWTASDMPSSGGYVSFPDATHVVVNYVNAGEETDNILLNQ